MIEIFCNFLKFLDILDIDSLLIFCFNVTISIIHFIHWFIIIISPIYSIFHSFIQLPIDSQYIFIHRFKISSTIHSCCCSIVATIKTTKSTPNAKSWRLTSLSVVGTDFRVGNSTIYFDKKYFDFDLKSKFSTTSLSFIQYFNSNILQLLNLTFIHFAKDILFIFIENSEL